MIISEDEKCYEKLFKEGIYMYIYGYKVCAFVRHRISRINTIRAANVIIHEPLKP